MTYTLPDQSESQADLGQGLRSLAPPHHGFFFHLNKKELCQGIPRKPQVTARPELAGWAAGFPQPPSLTWMGFSMSPSHRDTKGTVNGFHTGSSRTPTSGLSTAHSAGPQRGAHSRCLLSQKGESIKPNLQSYYTIAPPSDARASAVFRAYPVRRDAQPLLLSREGSLLGFPRPKAKATRIPETADAVQGL